MQDALLAVLLPLYGLLACGFLAGRSGVMEASHSGVLNKFVFSFSMPAFVFVSLSRVDAGKFFDWPFLGTLFSGMLIMLLTGFALARWRFDRTLAEGAVIGLSAMYSSTGYIGLPLLLLAFGDQALLPGVIGAVITGGVFMPIGIALAELGAREEGESRVLAPILGVLRNPVMIATFAGLLVAAIPIPLPAAVSTLCDILGQAYIPCALFAAGLFLSGSTAFTDRTESSCIILIKLIAHPALTWFIGHTIFGLDGLLLFIAVLQAALPAGVPVFVLAQNYRAAPSLANQVVTYSTIASMLTVPVWILALSN